PGPSPVCGGKGTVDGCDYWPSTTQDSGVIKREEARRTDASAAGSPLATNWMLPATMKALSSKTICAGSAAGSSSPAASPATTTAASSSSQRRVNAVAA